MDKDFFLAAVKSNEALLYKIASLYTNDKEDRNDLLQEIVYNLWKSFTSFNQNSSISTWMYRVAMNVAIYHLKKAKRKVVTVPINEQFHDVQEEMSGEFEERLQGFMQQVNHLNLLDKGIVLLYLENKSYKEIAQLTGLSETNIGTKLMRIKEKLKKQKQ
ncbi:MAG: sigma-70 family RNA polymerase sigma factor [Ferruginibacter sp.]